MIKSLITKESCAPQTRRCWIPAQGRNDGGGVREAVAPAAPGLLVVLTIAQRPCSKVVWPTDNNRHPGLDPGSSVIKSLITRESCALQTQCCWIPAQGRNDGGGRWGGRGPAADAPGFLSRSDQAASFSPPRTSAKTSTERRRFSMLWTGMEMISSSAPVSDRKSASLRSTVA